MSWRAAVSLPILFALPAAAWASDLPGVRHLIYLHGRIVQEQQSERPLHPKFGVYALDEITAALRGRGFEVEAEIRPKSATVSASADRVVERVRQLLKAGTAPERITVVGASMGAGIALLAAARLQNAEVRFALLGDCLSANARELAAAGEPRPRGHLLSIRETSDETTGGCPAWIDAGGETALLAVTELSVSSGLGHGFLYRPLPVWVDPVVAWAKGATNARPDLKPPHGS